MLRGERGTHRAEGSASPSALARRLSYKYMAHDGGEDTPLARVRAICLALPDTSERPSHSAPTFFVREKHSFVTYHENHHGDGRLALWCAAPPGLQQAMVEANPAHFFVPPYVGHLGWVGVHLNRGAAWEEIAAVIEDAYQVRAGKQARCQPDPRRAE